MTVRPRYMAHIYPTESDAHHAAMVLEEFGLKPAGPIELLADTYGGTLTGWEVVCVVPETRPERDPLDLDEAVDYVDSHWDRDADDRDINSRRGRHVD